MQERLQKILSARGVSSRRKAEEYIERGLVKVNGKIAKLGDKADPAVDTIEVDGKVLEERNEMLYYVMHKPVGVETKNVTGLLGPGSVLSNKKPVTSTQPTSNRPFRAEQSQKTVYDLLPDSLKGKVFPVGRLDKDSCGLLLFTNDGVLAYRLTHPKFDHEKEYEVTVDRPIPNMVLRHLALGVNLKEGRTKEAEAVKINPRTFRLTLTEGKNRQIRRMCQQEGFTVKELKRVRIMTLMDERLRSGDTRRLTIEEQSALLSSVRL